VPTGGQGLHRFQGKGFDCGKVGGCLIHDEELGMRRMICQSRRTVVAGEVLS